MRVNGKIASSGSVVVGPGDAAEIDFPFGTIGITFNPSNADLLRYVSLPNPTLIIGGQGNSLGEGSILDIPLSNGHSVRLSVMVYTIGAAPQLMRLVNYTAA